MREKRARDFRPKKSRCQGSMAEGAKMMPSEGREWQGGGGESPRAGRALAEVCDSVQGVRSGG